MNLEEMFDYPPFNERKRCAKCGHAAKRVVYEAGGYSHWLATQTPECLRVTCERCGFSFRCKTVNQE